MHRTVVATLSALALVATVGPADGSTCPLLTDPAGDTADTLPAEPFPYDPALDIRSADLASDGTVLTGVVRVQSLPMTPTVPFNRAFYFLRFTVAGHSFRYVAYRYPDGVARFYAQVVDDQFVAQRIPGYIDGHVDDTTGEIWTSAPLALLREYAPIVAGDVVSGVRVMSTREVDGVAVSYLHPADDAETAQTYAVDTPGCVTP